MALTAPTVVNDIPFKLYGRRLWVRRRGGGGCLGGWFWRTMYIWLLSVYSQSLVSCFVSANEWCSKNQLTVSKALWAALRAAVNGMIKRTTGSCWLFSDRTIRLGWKCCWSSHLRLRQIPPFAHSLLSSFLHLGERSYLFPNFAHSSSLNFLKSQTECLHLKHTYF